MLSSPTSMDRPRPLHHQISTSTFGAHSDSRGAPSPTFSAHSHVASPRMAAAGPPKQSVLKSTPNMAFNPIPTSPGKSSKLKINVLLDSTIYVAGGNLHGRLEVVSSSSKSLRLGEIAVELNGFEEVSDKDYARSQAFLSSRIVFQGDRLPPSNAVRGPSENGYWQANKGKTTFPFAFRLPDDAPSSYSFQSLASLRYVITGVVQYQQNGRSDSLFRSKEGFVVENWYSSNNGVMTSEPVRAKNHRKVWFGGAGEVHIEGTIQKSFFCSGNDVYVELRVRNESKRRVSGIKLSLVRKLLMVKDGKSKSQTTGDTKIVRETVAEVAFKEKDFIFDPGEDRANILNMQIPRFVRTCKHTALAEVACMLVMSLNMGTFNKELVIELPINVCHSASILPPPEIDTQANMHPQHYNVIPDDPEPFPSVRNTYRTRNKNWKATLRARSASPPKTIRGAAYVVHAAKDAPEQDQDDTRGAPTGRRALPWSDDEGDVQEFLTMRKRLARKAQQQMGRGVNEDVEDASSPFGGLLRELAPNSPSMATLRGVPSKGNIAKSPALDPATPISYIPATERSKYISNKSILLDEPASPTQETTHPTSPQSWGTHRISALSTDPLALPSPIMKARRPSLPQGLYEPTNRSAAINMSVVSGNGNTTMQATTPPHLRQARPLPSVPAVTASSPHRGRTNEKEDVPVQYRTISPPLKPRPANYVPKTLRDPKSLQNIRQPGARPATLKQVVSDEHLKPPSSSSRKRGNAGRKGEEVSQLSTIVAGGAGRKDRNFLDVSFDFGEEFTGKNAKTSTLARLANGANGNKSERKPISGLFTSSASTSDKENKSPDRSHHISPQRPVYSQPPPHPHQQQRGREQSHHYVGDQSRSVLGTSPPMDRSILYQQQQQPRMVHMQRPYPRQTQTANGQDVERGRPAVVERGRQGKNNAAQRTISPRAMSPQLQEYLAKYSEAASRV